MSHGAFLCLHKRKLENRTPALAFPKPQHLGPQEPPMWATEFPGGYMNGIQCGGDATIKSSGKQTTKHILCTLVNSESNVFCEEQNCKNVVSDIFCSKSVQTL